MTMIAVGQGLRGIANRGMSAVSRAEAVEEQQRMGIEAQKKAAEAQTMGTGAGIGGMVGAGKLAKAGKTATEAVSTLNSSIQGLGTTGIKGGSLTFTPAVEGAATLTGNSATMAIESAATIADAGAALGSTGTGAVGTGAVGTGAVGAGAVGTGSASAAATSATTAAASTGPMAALSTLAAPIAIGLGVSYLINKLFG
jgi:hypothetical protein